jgi:hypothetical protein
VATWHVREPVALREMIGDPGHDRAEEHSQAQDTRSGMVSGRSPVSSSR